MIFVDTSFWVALQLRRDAHHEEAVRLLRRYASDRLLTTNHIRGETWTFLRRRAGHAAAVNFLERSGKSPRLEVLFVADELEREALMWLRHQGEREYSFVDATSFAAMRSRRVNEALAFDGDFSAAGFQELRG